MYKNKSEINCTLNYLLVKINDLREELITIGLKDGINSINAIKLSQELDKHIIEYQKYRKLELP